MSFNINPQVSSQRNCRKSSAFFPDLNPVINTLSPDNSNQGIYTTVYITGNNFSNYGSLGYSVVNFGNYKNLPVSFYNSQYISFSVPTGAYSGSYSVTVENKSSYVNFSYYKISNSVEYIIN